MSEIWRPNRGWFLGVAGMLAAWILERIDAPIALAALTLIVMLLAAATWPWIEQTRARRMSFWLSLAVYVLVVVAIVVRGASTVPAGPVLDVTGQRVEPVAVDRVLAGHVDIDLHEAVRLRRAASIAVLTFGAPLAPAEERTLIEQHWTETWEQSPPDFDEFVMVPRGQYSPQLSGAAVTQADVDAIQAHSAVVLLMGKFDFISSKGSGTFEFCRFTHDGRVFSLCLNHNGLVQ